MSKFLIVGFVLTLSVLSTDKAVAAFDGTHPAFTLPVLQPSKNHVNATQISLQDYRGKLVYIDFWASWCGPCVLSMPFLDNLDKQFGAQGFEVIAVNVDEDIEDAQAFLQRVDVGYPIVFDENKILMASMDIKGLPTAFLINEHGKVIYQHQGFKPSDKAYLTAIIDKELARIAFEK